MGADDEMKDIEQAEGEVNRWRPGVGGSDVQTMRSRFERMREEDDATAEYLRAIGFNVAQVRTVSQEDDGVDGARPI